MYYFIKLMFGASFCLLLIDAMPRNQRPQGQQGNQQHHPYEQHGQHNYYPPGQHPPIYYPPPILHPQPPMMFHHPPPPPPPFIPAVQLHPILPHPPPAVYYPAMHPPGPPPPQVLPPDDLAYGTHHYHQYQPGWDQQLYHYWHQNNPVQSSMQYPGNTTHSGESSNIQNDNDEETEVVQSDDDEKIFLPKSLEENDHELEEVKPRNQTGKRKDFGKKKGI